MLNDTVALAIPIKHVHPLGKCNRTMSALLKKHRGGRPALNGDEDAEDFDDEALDVMDLEASSEDAGQTSDPRWDKLRELGNLDNED